MTVRVKPRAYAVALDRRGRLTQEDGRPLEYEGRWTPEHLLLAALADCAATSLGYHARREELRLSAAGSASGVVARRDDSSWGFVEIECILDVELEPAPSDLRALLARAERGCFVGASLVPKPRYRWIVNGGEIR